MKISAEKIKECAEFVEQYGLSQHGGATLYEFCQQMDISNATYYDWSKPNEDGSESIFSIEIKKAKAVFKARLMKNLVNALTRKALGYEDEKTEQYGSLAENGRFETVKAKRTKVNVPPDTGAAIFLLTNLDPENYKNRQDSTARIEEVKRAEIIVENEEDKQELEKARNGFRRKQ